MTVAQLEPIRPKREFPQFFPLSVRTFERCLQQGIPHYRARGASREAIGKVGFRPSEVEPWLIEHGYLEKKGNDE